MRASALALAVALGAPLAAQTPAPDPAAIDPASPEARQAGLSLGAQGRLEEAYRLLGPWAQAHPEDVEATAAAAFCALELGRLKDADALLERLPAEPPAFRLLRARSRLRHEDPEGAIALLAPVANAATGRLAADILRSLAEAHVLAGSAAETIRLLAGRAATPDLALLLARAQYQVGDLEMALTTLDPYPEGGPDPAVASSLRLLRGRLLLLAGRGEQAVPLLERAAEAAATDKETWMLLGQARAASGDAAGAEAAFGHLARLQEESESNTALDRRIVGEQRDPTGFEIGRAWDLLESGEPEQSLGVALGEERLAPDDPRPRAAAAAALLALGRLDEAAAMALRVGPSPPPGPTEARRLALLADRLAAAGLPEPAAAVRRRATAGTP